MPLCVKDAIFEVKVIPQQQDMHRRCGERTRLIALKGRNSNQMSVPKMSAVDASVHRSFRITLWCLNAFKLPSKTLILQFPIIPVRDSDGN